MSEAIGAIAERAGRGPRSGTFPLFDWKPSPWCPVHLSPHINTATRIKDIHRDLLDRHYSKSSSGSARAAVLPEVDA